MTNLKNDTRRDDFIKAAREYGRESASGRDAKAKLALLTVRAAQDDVISDADAEFVYDEYAAAESKKSIHDHAAGGKKANVSKLRQIILLGANPHVDGVQLLDKVTDIRSELRGSDEKLKPAFDTFVDVARAQLRDPENELDSDSLRAICVKPEKDPKSELQEMCEEYRRLYKLAERIPSCEAPMHAMGEAIVEMGGELPPVTKEQEKAAREKAAFLRKADKLGYAIAA